MTAAHLAALDGLGVHPLVATAFDTLDDAQVSWAVLHGESQLASPPGDVDLLVHPRDAPAASRALRAAGFRSRRACGHPWHTMFVGYDPSTGRWIKLDVVSHLTFGPRHALATGLEDAVLAGVAGWPRVLAPQDAFWTLLLHALLDKDGVEPKHRARLQMLASAVDLSGPIASVAERLTDDGAAHLVALVRREAWDQLAARAPEMRRRVRRHARGARALAARHRHRLGQLRRPLFRRGFSVALLGPDGAGKSTLAAAITAEAPFPVRTVVLAPYRRHTRARHLPHGIGFAARVSRLWLRFAVVAWHRARGRLVLIDRYPYDALIGREQRRGRLRRVRDWMLGHALPSPDLTLVLDAPAADLFGRKGEHTPEHLARLGASYRRLASRLPSALTLDAGRPAHVVRRDATAMIWHAWTGEE